MDHVTRPKVTPRAPRRHLDADHQIKRLSEPYRSLAV
jgi:hypothetical protein